MRCAASATVASGRTVVETAAHDLRRVAIGSEGSASAGAREALRAWYRPRRRSYAWRRTRDPYAVLVSEVMLQQTQAPRVEPLFVPFLERFPTVEVLAEASRADVLRAWAGLGYHRRAVRLHEAARAIVREHDGRVPQDVATLLTLPGVGPYTVAAVASIAFGDRAAAVDVNVARVVARVRRGREPDEVSHAEVTAEANAWIDPDDPGAWNQAVMDLGREYSPAGASLRRLSLVAVVQLPGSGPDGDERSAGARDGGRARAGRHGGPWCALSARWTMRRSRASRGRPASSPIGSATRSPGSFARASSRNGVAVGIGFPSDPLLVDDTSTPV